MKAEYSMTKSSELRQNWKVIAACFIGLIFSLGPIVTYSFSIFAPELMKEHGWSRTEVFFGFTLHNIGVLVGAPLVGYMVDKVGARRVILYSVPLFAVMWGSLGSVFSIWHFYLILILVPILAGGTMPMSYSMLIVSNFDKQRGLALGLALAGVGVGAAVVPVISRAAIDVGGTMLAYPLIGILIILISLPNALFLIKPRHVVKRDIKAGNAETKAVWWREVFRVRMFWIMALFILCSGFAITAVLINLVPILTENGLDAQSTAFVASMLGVAVLVGRLSVGFLLDKVFAPYVTSVVLFAPAIACYVLSGAPSQEIVYVCAILVGLAVGAEVDLIAFLVSRYFSRKLFGFLNGLMFSFFVASGAVGPLVVGYMRDTYGDYMLSLKLLAAIIAVGAIAILAAPKYRH